jgi:hypothetical protein
MSVAASELAGWWVSVSVRCIVYIENIMNLDTYKHRDDRNAGV